MAKMGYARARRLSRDRAEEEVFAPMERRGHIDLQFLLLVLLLLTAGVFMVLSASSASAYYELGKPAHYFTRQFAFAAAGAAAMVLVSRVRVETMRRGSMWLLALSVALLALVLFAKPINGARRWFDLGFTTAQPSEIAKLGIIMSFSVMMCKYGESLRKLKKSSWKSFVSAAAPFAGALGVTVALLLREPHNSAAVIIVAIAAVVMFAGGLDMKLCVAAVAAAVIAAGFLISRAESSYAEIAATGGGDYAFRRIVFWLHPEADPSGGGYQTLQSLYAIGSGGLTGLGLGQSRQKYLYLPEEHNDYIFAIFCEEFGFIGAALILALFALLIIRGFWIAMHARRKFDALVASGITGMLAIQVFLNISVVTNLLPCTGISLPFFSYGGSALVVQLAEMGIILSISRDMPITRAG